MIKKILKNKDRSSRRILFYIPNGLMIPEIHLMISLVQNYLDNPKNQVTILTCAGSNNSTCSLNIFAVKEICKSCILRRNSALSKLNGNYQKIEIEKKFNFIKKIHIKNIKNLTYEGIDFGLGVYSSYTNTTKDSYFKGKNSKKVIKNLLDSSFSFYNFFKNYININKIDELILYNSRMSEKRPIFRLASRKKIKVSNYEKLSTERFYNFEDNLSQDRKFIRKEILKFEKKKLNDFKKERSFFLNKFLSKKDPINSIVYSKKQKHNKLPIDWKQNLKNLVFFTSSDDEHLSFGREFNPLFAVDQQDVIKKTCEIIKDKENFFLWIRIHPSLRFSKWLDRNFYNLLEKKYKNVKIIYPEENISSYAIMEKAFNVICFWSFLLVESAFWRGKKPISLTRNDMTEYGVAIVPNSVSEYKYLILKKFKTNNQLKTKALKYAKFFLNGGSKIKYFSGSFEDGYKFKNHDLKLNINAKLFYVIGKSKEKIINYILN